MISKLKIAVALLAVTLLVGCEANRLAEPADTTAVVPLPIAIETISPTAVVPLPSAIETISPTAVVPLPSTSVTIDPTASPVSSSVPAHSYTSTPSKELMAFAEVLKARTTPDMKNALVPEWRRYPLADYGAGVDLTYDEFTALANATGCADLSGTKEEVQSLTRAQYDARPSSWIDDAVQNLAQKPEWADVNGDGVSEIVMATRTGGGSEGGSVIVYAVENGNYVALLNFYIGMQNVFTLAQQDGCVFLVVACPNRVLADTTATPDKNGSYPESAYIYVVGYGIRRFSEDWVPECLIVDQGETWVPEYDWFWGVDL